MLIGTIRPVETRTVRVEGPGLPEVAALVAEQTPEGWQAVEMPVSMSKHETVLTSEATIARRDGLEEIQGADYAAVIAAVPEGYQLLSVRPA